MTKFKTLTHVMAGAFVAISGFLLTPAGEAVLKQYPHLAVIVGGLMAVGATYFKSKEPA